MKYLIKISPKAFDDIQQSVTYYNSRQKGLGKRFHTVIKSTIENIKKMPLAASLLYDDARYKVVDKFPYIIIIKHYVAFSGVRYLRHRVII